MLKKIQQVLRAVMFLGKHRQRRGFKPAGGLLVLLWTETASPAESLNCTVAAAGPWCTGIQLEALQPVLTDVKESLFPSMWPCPQPDPEELCAFTDVYGRLRLLLSFQTQDETYLPSEWSADVEAFLHSFSLANAKIVIHLKVKSEQLTMQRVFRVGISSKVALTKPSLVLGVTSRTRPPEFLKKGGWCHGGHPVLGERLLLSIPPETMDRGLFGELSVQPVTFLSPCVLQYPNLATRLTHIQMWARLIKHRPRRLMLGAAGVFSDSSFEVTFLDFSCAHVLVWGPSNVPVTGPSAFLQELPAHLDCQQLGLHGLHCSSSKDPLHSVGTVHTLEKDDWEDLKEESSIPSVPQCLLLFLFLQHSDPFTLQLSDVMASEVLLEHHLEDILNHNRQAVLSALQTELKNTLKAQSRRKKEHEKLCSAAEVILNSSISIMSCSTNLEFRNACLKSMKVDNTHELSASLRKSLMRVTSWKFIPRSKCYSAEMEEQSECDDLTRAEI